VKPLTFDEAKKVAIHHLSEIANFMENLNNLFHDRVPIDWVILIRTIEMKVNQASACCLEKKDVQLFLDLARQLIQGNPNATQQLAQFWNLYSEVFKILKAHPNLKHVLPNIINNNWNRIEKADSLAEKLVLEAKNDPSSFAFPTALLLAHVMRTETIEYSFTKQLSEIVDKFKKHGLKEYDIALICSVYNTVLKHNKRTNETELRSDVRAYRDSIAHGHFTILKTMDGYEMKFDNEEYPFKKVISTKEFYKFFDLHTILYKTQFILLMIVELVPILTTYFLKRPTSK